MGVRNKVLLVAAAVAVLAVGGVAGFKLYMGDSGATTEIGGELEAPLIPEFPEVDAKHWVNGEPASLAALRGKVVLIEAWHPS